MENYHYKGEYNMKIIDAINKINKEEKFRFKLLSDGDIY